jgi:hypothetical protein
MEGIIVQRKKNVVTGKIGMTRTTLILPVELWQEAKIRAIRDGCDLTDVVRIALEKYLGERKGGGR